MDNLDGWQRLWVVVKWIMSIVAGLTFSLFVLAQTIPHFSSGLQPTPGQILIGFVIMAVVGGGITFGSLHALEWVYRGYRPLPPTAKADTANESSSGQQ